MNLCLNCIHGGVCEWSMSYCGEDDVYGTKSCDDYINEKEHVFYNQFMKIWKESDFPEELEMYTSDLLIQLGINEDIDDDDK